VQRAVLSHSVPEAQKPFFLSLSDTYKRDSMHSRLACTRAPHQSYRLLWFYKQRQPTQHWLLWARWVAEAHCIEIYAHPSTVKAKGQTQAPAVVHRWLVVKQGEYLSTGSNCLSEFWHLPTHGRLTPIQHHMECVAERSACYAGGSRTIRKILPMLSRRFVAKMKKLIRNAFDREPESAAAAPSQKQ
jgi:hypothetical protein